MIQFTVHSVPVAQPRQRHAVIAGHVRNYIPTEHPVVTFKSDCRRAAAAAYSGAPIDYPIRLRIVTVFPRPTNKIWKKREMPQEPKASKPDFDNLAKSVCDALTGLIWRDDALVTDGRVIKRIASGMEAPHVEITIEQDLGNE